MVETLRGASLYPNFNHGYFSSIRFTFKAVESHRKPSNCTVGFGLKGTVVQT